MRKWRSTLFAGVIGAVLMVSACGGSGQDDGKGSDGPTKVAAGAAPGTSAPAGGDPAEAAGQLTARKDAKLGPIITDGAGFTLYRFDKDTAGNGKSACVGECATTWPPVLADDPVASSDINPELLGTVTRDDGKKQVSVAGWPLYRFADDAKAGDTNGQGVGGVWFAAAPDARKAGVARPALGSLDSPSLGKILTDKDGRTLYLFTKDTPWPMKTACDAACLAKWTPAGLVDAADAKALGIDPKALFTFTTPDGTKQESFNCWPAYTFNGDTGPGQTNGQGVGGVWFAIKQDVAVDRGKTVPAAKEQPGGADQDAGGAQSDAPADPAGDDLDLDELDLSAG